jgi:putative ABC transport system ATP-binding protein
MTTTPSTTAGLVLRGITATVPDGTATRTLLDAVDLEIAAGELVVVTGPSGSGKSTLLSIAGLLASPDAGEVTIAGNRSTGLSEAGRTALRRTHIGIVYQSANLISSLSAIEQLELVGRINHDKPRRSAERAASLLDEVGLASRAHALPSELSGGERQRVGIARALMAEPSVLLCDEPTSSLDPALAEDIAALLAAQTTQRSLATLLVTHDEEPLAHADRRVELLGGGLRDLEITRS